MATPGKFRRCLNTLPDWFRIIILAVAVAAPVRVEAQAPPEFPEPGETVYEVTMVDGTTVFGRITSVDGPQIVLTTVGMVRMEIQRSQIRHFGVAQGRIVKGEFWARDPNTSRLFFTATGRSLDAGEGYVGTYLIVLPFAAVGVTDDFTMAVGAPVLTGDFEPFYIAPKLRVVDTEFVDLSVGTLLFLFDDESVGVAYGVGTFGTLDQALTLGVGFGYSGKDFESQPVAVVGGEVRVSQRTKLITENYFLPGEKGLVFSGGLRFLGKRFSTDLGIAGYAGDNESACCLPLLNFSYKIGNRR
jgi:hypothetical protein